MYGLKVDFTLGHKILGYRVCVVSRHILLCVFSYSSVHADDGEGRTVGTRSVQEGNGVGRQESVWVDVGLNGEDRSRLESLPP